MKREYRYLWIIKEMICIMQSNLKIMRKTKIIFLLSKTFLLFKTNFFYSWKSIFFMSPKNSIVLAFFLLRQKDSKKHRHCWLLRQILNADTQLQLSELHALHFSVSIIRVRNCRQITFVTLNRFCPLSKNPHTSPVPNEQYQNE